MSIARPVCAGLALLLCAGAWAASFGSSVGSAMGDLPQLKSFKAERQSSADPSGGNADGRQDAPIQPGETRTMADIAGAGAITHIWVTIASQDPQHLRNLVLRMYWDGEQSPSVETPIGDFFGIGHAQYYQYSSMPIQIGTDKGMNCFWRQPFSNGARVTITNDGPLPVRAFYYYVDYQTYDSLPDDVARFHAQYRQAFPCPEGQNYVFMEATGQGHYVGCNLSIHNRADGWWGEGDDMIYVDGEEKPSLQGTGSEDYFGGAWCYGAPFSDLYLGCPLRGEHKINELWNVYRYHIEDPIPFQKSIRVTIEHGHANDRSDDFSSVAYWYQTEPHAAFPALPAAAQRMHTAAQPPEVPREDNAMEAEDNVAQWKGGPVSVQDLLGPNGAWSAGKQLFFQPEGPTTYTYTFETGEAGHFNVEQWYTVAPDYGTCELWLNGEKLAQWDGFNADGVARKKIEFALSPKGGQNALELRVTGKNAESAGYYAGIDAWRVVPR